MQRQSLGSPSPTISPSSPHHEAEEEEEDELKPQKKLLHRTQDQRFIHLIPLLAILCFLILYLSSHHPQQTEMAEFKFNKKLQNHIDRIDEMEANKGDILAMGSLRNLQETEKEEGRASSKYHKLARKIGDF